MISRRSLALLLVMTLIYLCASGPLPVAAATRGAPTTRTCSAAGCSGRAAPDPTPVSAVSTTVALDCPALLVRNSRLGVALTPLPSWEEAGPDKYPPGYLALEIPQPGQDDADLRLVISSLGTADGSPDTAAAAARMARLTRGLTTPYTVRPIRIGGAPGLLARGLPGDGPVTVIVLAHGGVVYQILAPGADLAPDQRQVLATLRFIPRVGSFPPATPLDGRVGLPPAPLLGLAMVRAARQDAVAIRAHGHGYRAHERVTLHLCWVGVARGSPHPFSRWLALAPVVQASRLGAFDLVLTIPVSPQAYATAMVRVSATDTLIGNRLTSATIQPMRPPGSAAR